MKLILIIAFLLTLTACNFLHNHEANSLRDDEEEYKPKSMNVSGIGFMEKFRNELIENNTGDLGKRMTDSDLMTKALKFTDITTTIAEEFGVDVMFPTFVKINRDDVSKVEVSFSVKELESSYAAYIKSKIEGNEFTRDNRMEFLLTIK
jgi:hypothetical protein